MDEGRQNKLKDDRFAKAPFYFGTNLAGGQNVLPKKLSASLSSMEDFPRISQIPSSFPAR